MLKLTNIKLPCDTGMKALPGAISALVGIKEERIIGIKLLRLSVD